MSCIPGSVKTLSIRRGKAVGRGLVLLILGRVRFVRCWRLEGLIIRLSRLLVVGIRGRIFMTIAGAL